MYWYSATSLDQALTSTFVARLLLHLRAVGTISDNTTTYMNPFTSHGFDGEFTSPAIAITMTGESRLENESRHADTESFCKTREDDDAEALEMQVKSLSA